MRDITLLTQNRASHDFKIHQSSVSLIIATLLFVAIAVVGGSIIFSFSQGFFATAQISGQPQIDSIEIVGYDASDVTELTMHDGVLSGAVDGVQDGAIAPGERIAIYVQNRSVQKVIMTEVLVAGNLYRYASGLAVLPDNSDPADGNYFVVLRGDPAPANAILSPGKVAELEAGAEATIIVDLLSGIKNGRDIQFRIATSNGGIFVGTAISGQQSG